MKIKFALAFNFSLISIIAIGSGQMKEEVSGTPGFLKHPGYLCTLSNTGTDFRGSMPDCLAGHQATKRTQLYSREVIIINIS